MTALRAVRQSAPAVCPGFIFLLVLASVFPGSNAFAATTKAELVDLIPQVIDHDGKDLPVSSIQAETLSAKPLDASPRLSLLSVLRPFGTAWTQIGIGAIWNNDDIFHQPGLTGKKLLQTIFEHEADWGILAVTIVVLVVIDCFVLQPMAVYFNRKGVEEAEETSLKEAFEKCDKNGTGKVTKAELEGACQGIGASLPIQTLTHRKEGEPISWEELQTACQTKERKEPGPGPVGMGSVRMNLAALIFWVSMGAVFNAIVLVRRGEEAAVHWCTGYLLEWLLSLDNLFVFHLIFRTYATPRDLLHKALFLGILGAVIFRMFFFIALTSLLHIVKWVRFIFGLLLIFSGIQAARDNDDDVDVSNTWAVRLLRRCLGSRLQESYDHKGWGLFVKGEDGRWKATLLVLVITCLEMTDIFFAIDSVSAKVAQIPNYYLAYSSSVIALFGLRAMFFLVQDMVDSFELLKYGLCFILVFIGIELMVADWVQLPAQVVCAVIVSVFLVGVAGSLAQKYMTSEQKEEELNDDASTQASDP